MPTGYTAAIKDGISFEKFVWNCARAMGALVMMRDEASDAPIPQRFEPSDYNTRNIAELRAELARLESLTIEQVQAEGEAAYTAAVERHETRSREVLELRNKYMTMLAKVVRWTPPTPEHQGFKDFMADQLRQSIDFDCNTSYYEAPAKQDATAWHNAQLAETRRQIAYHLTAQAEEIERTEDRNAWIAALRESVPPAA